MRIPFLLYFSEEEISAYFHVSSSTWEKGINMQWLSFRLYTKIIWKTNQYILHLNQSLYHLITIFSWSFHHLSSQLYITSRMMLVIINLKLQHSPPPPPGNPLAFDHHLCPRGGGCLGNLNLTWLGWHKH